MVNCKVGELNLIKQTESFKLKYGIMEFYLILGAACYSELTNSIIQAKCPLVESFLLSSTFNLSGMEQGKKILLYLNSNLGGGGLLLFYGIKRNLWFVEFSQLK